MEILQLKYFCSAAQNESFSKTAKKYNVPVSDISQSIHRLENELNVKLFDRFANKIALNDKGKVFYLHINAALVKIDEARGLIQDDAQELSGTISVLICTNRRIVSIAINSFMELYPNVIFKISHDYDIDDSFDIVISDEIPGHTFTKKQLLISEEICVCMSKKNKLSKKEKISISDIKDEKFVAMQNKSSQYKTTKRICRENGFCPEIIIQTDDPFYIRQYVETGLGIAIIPMFSWKGQFSDNVVFKAIGHFTRNTYIFVNNKKYVSKPALCFIEILSDICRKSLQ